MVGAVPRQPTAVLVVSAWHEGAPPTLAARITYTLAQAGIYLSELAPIERSLEDVFLELTGSIDAAPPAPATEVVA